MGLLEDVRLLSEQLRKRQANVKGEEATKQALIVPFISVLGYDVYEPTEVQPEYVADFAKKRSGGPAEKVDYAIHMNGEVAIFVECKSVGTALENHDAQLARYFNSMPTVKTAVITNGIQYKFFTDLQQPNVMDPAPFFEFNVLSFTERDVETLRAFTKGSFNPSTVRDQAEELIFTSKVTGLVNRLLRDPSQEFVWFLLKEAEVVPGKITAKVLERFTPIVKRAIQSTLVEVMTKSLQQGIAHTPAPPAVAAAPAAPTATPQPAPAADPAAAPTNADAAAKADERIVTTDEELHLFEIVKKICAESQVVKTISYKDTVSYFGINLGGVRSWFMRFVSKDDKKYFVTRLPADRATSLANGFRVEPSPEGSRVWLTTVDDLEKIKALVLSAYEDEAKRRDSGADEDSAT